jgi:hypothetical protein
VFTLAELEQAIRASWSLDTSDDPDEWSPENAARGHVPSERVRTRLGLT